MFLFSFLQMTWNRVGPKNRIGLCPPKVPTQNESVCCFQGGLVAEPWATSKPSANGNPSDSPPPHQPT